MSETRRPHGRFFCGRSGASLRRAGGGACPHTGKLISYLVLWLVSPMGLMVCLGVGSGYGQSGPATTTISDTVYRADGSPAGGVLLISWGGFTTADGKPVAGGNLSVNLGAGGALSVALVPNSGATPANSLYTVVFQLDDHSVRTEYWLVPTTSPTTLAAVRTTPGSGTAAQLASRQYVDTALEGKASDQSVVHLGGAETIAGTKQFAAPPSVPAPVGNADAANKAYVDEAVAAIGAGAFVSKTGDAMTGPLILPGEPGRMKLAEDRIGSLERNDARRGVYDRIVNAFIAIAISGAIALREHLGLR